jgi:beta-lactamase superfamily II metal-dependent hydrolase
MLVLLSLNIFLWWSVTTYLDSRLEITFLDVGQGDSYLIETPDNLTMLVDAGKGDAVLQPLQENLRYGQEVDVVMLSHPDADHVGNLAYVVDNYAVKQVLTNDVTHKNQGYTNFLSAIEDPDIEVIKPIARSSYRFGCCVLMDFYWPQYEGSDSTDDKGEVDVNDLSLAYQLSYGEFDFFAAGDLSASVEERIVTDNDLGSVDLLKVSHHGSETSTNKEFLWQLLPHTSVIQVGENTYGHPHQQVIDNLRSADTRIFRNDKHGDIVYMTDGSSYSLSTQNEDK